MTARKTQAQKVKLFLIKWDTQKNSDKSLLRTSCPLHDNDALLPRHSHHTHTHTYKHIQELSGQPAWLFAKVGPLWPIHPLHIHTEWILFNLLL